MTCNEGGGERFYYLGAMHAVTAEGNVYFTAAGTGRLYLRVNPTKAPSPVDGQGKCEDPQLACTIHVSASRKTDGTGKGGTDSVGPQPAAFQGATESGSQVFFTSSEKLTNDANTGLEQPLASIGSAKLGTTAEDVEPDLFKEEERPAAVGLARHGSWLYWADPLNGRIGRVNLNAEEEPELATMNLIFIPPPPSQGECEEEADPEHEPGVFTPIAGPIPSEPRYLAVDASHVYWTNTGRRSNIGVAIDGGGTIGRATLNGSEALEPATIEPAFICGEEADKPGERLVSNPQGIAVNESHIYWANAAQLEANGGFRTIARAEIDGSGAEEEFIHISASGTPYGVALDASHIYYDANDENNNFSYLTRTNLEGKEEKFIFIGDVGLARRSPRRRPRLLGDAGGRRLDRALQPRTGENAIPNTSTSKAPPTASPPAPPGSSGRSTATRRRTPATTSTATNPKATRLKT